MNRSREHALALLERAEGDRYVAERLRPILRPRDGAWAFMLSRRLKKPSRPC